MHTPIRILHLSDFHLCHKKDNPKVFFSYNNLLEDLSKISKDKNFDIVLITGDLLDKGGASFNSIEDAFLAVNSEILEPLMKSLNIDKTQIFFIPGNHDINIKLDDDIVESGINHTLKDISSIEKFVSERSYSNELGVKRVLPFKNFERDFYKDCFNQQNINLFSSAYVKEINGVKIGLACINSAWRCNGSSDYGKLLIAKKQISDCMNIINKSDVKIALTHHSLDYICDFEKRIIENLFVENFDLHFIGHVHDSMAYSTQYCKGNLFTAIASSCTNENINSNNFEYLNSYNYYDLDWSNNKIVLYSRILVPSNSTYCNNVKFFNGGSDHMEFSLNKDCVDFVETHKIVENILDNFSEQSNLDVISNSIESIAPTTLNEIFVEPNIEYWTEDNIDNNKSISVDQILKNKENYIIFGMKEIGKTVLLDKLVIEYLNRINELQTIPILYNFIKNKTSTKIETIISNFINLSIKEVPKFIKNNNIVLLIDDVSFDDKYKYELKKLDTFAKQYENIQIVCCSLLNLEGSIPPKFFDSIFSTNLKVLNFKYYKTKQIRDLTEKWYSKSIIFEKKERTEKIIKLLQSLELPRTPISISMFLWIFEKNENYQPANQAVMLEQFIEKMFQKNSKNELSFNEFNYTNKIILLTNLAKEMYNKNNINYSLSYSEIQTFFVKHLNKRKFNNNAIELINYFCEIGLFNIKKLDSDTFITFRFNCFFQFFLMKNMDDKDFSDFILSEENYLFFIDEINYYTGINRNKLEILEKIIERMDNVFSLIKEKISIPTNIFYDLCFNKKQSISEQLNPVLDLNENKTKIKDNKITSVDKLLESQNVSNQINKKEDNLSNFEQLERLYILASNVLRNTDEIEKENIKYDSFIKILDSAMVFSCITKMILLEKLENYKTEEDDSNRQSLYIILDFIPVLLQLSLKDNLMSSKLEIVVLEHINKILSDNNVSELEKIVTVLLYADIQGDNYRKKIKLLIQTCNKKYSYDTILFKMLILYFDAQTDIEEKFYLNCLSDIIVKSKSGNRAKVDKTKAIEHFKNLKKEEMK